MQSTTTSDRNDNTLGNKRNMAFVDVDGVSGTNNSSSSCLNLPSGSTITFARIYWGGMVKCSDWKLSTVQSVKVRKGTGTYTGWTAARVNWHPNDYDNSQIEYQAYIDVTSWLQGMGTATSSSTGANGTYWVANVDATPGNFSAAGAYAGWTLVVVYQTPTSATKSVRIYDGYQNVFDEGHATTNTITLQNLNVPSGTNNARLGVVVWEGDGDLTGDYMKFNGTKVSNSSSSTDNIWNGTISGQTYACTRNVNNSNQMSEDLDQFNVSSLVQAGNTSAQVICYTTGDSYYPGVFAFSANFSNPQVTIKKTVRNANGSAFLTSGQVVYTLAGQNTSTTNGLNSYIVDTLPQELSFPNPATSSSPNVQISTNNGTSWSSYSAYAITTLGDGTQIIKINLGTGATASAGGTLASGASYLVRFTANVLDASEDVTNLATVFIHDQSGHEYTDESTVTISPSSNIPLPAKFSAFTVKRVGTVGQLDWTTLVESYNSSFDIERSSDGMNFTKVGSVAGKGSSENVSNYQYSDPLLGVNGRIVYYRLKLTDISGNGSYTQILPLNLDVANAGLIVYPNPFSSGIKVLFHSLKAGMVTVKVSSITGQAVNTREVKVQEGDNVIELSDLQSLKPGSFMLQVITDDNVLSQQIIKR